MRVLIDYRPALSSRTGAGEYTHQLVKALLNRVRLAQRDGERDRDMSIALFSSSWKDRLRDNGELDGATLIDRRVPVRLLNFAWHRLEWPPIEVLAGGDIHVAHSSHPLLMPSRRAAQVVTIHDLYFLAHPERTSAEIRRDYPGLVRRHAHRAARIIVPSRFTAGEVERRLDVAPAQIATCPPGAPAWTPRERLNTDGYILFFSTLEPRKNVSGLLDAYERLVGQDPRFRVHNSQAAERNVPELVLAGKATDDARPWLDRLKRRPLAGHVRHIGYVEPEDRQALYSGARLLVMPSFEEGFGIPVLEAMTFGVPVVAAARGSLPEVVGDAGPLVNPDDPVAIAAAMARVLEEDGYAAACREKGIARARQFNWDRTAQLIADVYASAAGHRGTRDRDIGTRTIGDRAIGDSRSGGRRRSAMGD